MLLIYYNKIMKKSINKISQIFKAFYIKKIIAKDPSGKISNKLRIFSSPNAFGTNLSNGGIASKSKIYNFGPTPIIAWYTQQHQIYCFPPKVPKESHKIQFPKLQRNFG